MNNFADIVTGEILNGVAQANATVRNGMAAQGVLADATVNEFFTDQTRDLVKALLAVDTSDEKALAAIVIGIKAVGALHNHLTQAVTSGLAAAQRLNEQATQGEAK